MKKLITLILAVLFISLAGCGESPVNVETADPEEASGGTETLDIRNCDSIEDMNTTLAAQAPVKQTVTIPEQANLEKNGSVVDIPPDVADELKLAVESAYLSEYKAAVSAAEGVKFTIPGDKIHMYKIFWIQRTYHSTISFSIDRKPCTIFMNIL